jgi:tetratricopeptide (TPR) repeat protein
MAVSGASSSRAGLAFGLSLATRVALALVVCLVAVAGYTVWRDRDRDINGTPAARAEQGMIDAIKKDPSAPGPRVALAEAYLSMYRFDDAIRAANRALSISRDLPHAYLIEGLAYLNKSDYVSARANLDQVVSALKDSPMARTSDDLQQAFFYLGVTYYRQGDWDAAMQNLRASLSMQASSSDTLYFIGAIYLKKNAPDLAVQALEAAVAYDPKFTAAQFDLGKAYLALGQKTLAAEHFRLAWESSGEQLGDAKLALDKMGSPATHLLAADKLLEAGRLKAGVGELELAVALDPLSPQANFTLGTAYEAQAKAARTESERLLRLSMAQGMYQRVAKWSVGYPGIAEALKRTQRPKVALRPARRPKAPKQKRLGR